jgi:hypothetical protein
VNLPGKAAFREAAPVGHAWRLSIIIYVEDTMKRMLNAFAVFSIAALAACASTAVTERDAYEGAALPRPGRIIVHDFTANPDEFPAGSALADNAGERPTSAQLQEAHKLGAEVAKQLVSKLSSAGLPAVQAAGQPAPELNDIVIRGYFVTFDEGSAAKRVLIGFGSGDAKQIEKAAEKQGWI